MEKKTEANARYRVSPDAFVLPDDRYLGNPDVVARLVGGFIAQIEAYYLAISQGRMSADAAKQQVAADVMHIADIVSGRDPAWRIIKGYHDFTLGNKLMADLGSHWKDHAVQWNNDPVCVLFDWVAAWAFEHIKRADGDDMLLGVMLRPTVDYAVHVILGTEKRAQA